MRAITNAATPKEMGLVHWAVACGCGLRDHRCKSHSLGYIVGA